MLADVLAAAVAIGTTWVVTPDPRRGRPRGGGATVVPDPGGGQGAAVEAGLRRPVPGRCSS